MDDTDRAAYLTVLSPGADIDHRGTPFTPNLLNQLLAALRDPTTGKPRTGEARFDGATFSGEARFNGATFSREVRFDGATFSRKAQFRETTFTQDARFDGAAFSGETEFENATFSHGARFGKTTFSCRTSFDVATFSDQASFAGATFSGEARFIGARFSRTWFSEATFSAGARFVDAKFSEDARFDGTTFSRDTSFQGATFSGDARFHGARFEMSSFLGPLVCSKQVVMDGAVFGQPVTVEIAAHQVSCVRTRWASTATLRLRYAELDLRDAVFEYPVTVAARPNALRSRVSVSLSEAELSGREPGVRLMSVDGVDAAHLALQDIDLSACRFAGVVHLDQLKVDGWCTFAGVPAGWGRPFSWPSSQRNTLVEEHHWRVRTARRPGRAVARGWTSPQDAPVLKPAMVAALYRQLRKSLEDGKNEPDAADFYYGESEMRRHDVTRPWGERALLTAYWALSGYGLRAIRTLAWLVAAMAATIAVMVLWGLPADDPKPTTTGRQVAVGQEVLLTTDVPAPVNPSGPLTERVTTERLEKGLRVVINSVIFRSSGQDLTATGTYTEMTSRLAEPVLLGLAVLAVRSRVKR
ncbi:hypothetical protein AQJ43_37975 [Streptomyces avermitilis]|nr:hypothetical protein AQJ43_37975 [Streptomyces avermitilis]